MSRTYILDTNVLIADPQCFFKFQDNNVIIPLKAIEEIDSFKSEMSERGRAARQVSRTLDSLRKLGHLLDGVKSEDGGLIRVAVSDQGIIGKMPAELTPTNDIHILAVALQQDSAILVTRDANLRIVADIMGVPAEDYRSDKVAAADLYTGMSEVQVDPDAINDFYANKKAVVGGQLHPNEYVLLKAYNNQSAICRHTSNGYAVPLNFEPVWGIEPKNLQQKFALDAMLNDDIKLVTLCGKAGTGKTLLAIAAGLMQVAERSTYKRVLAARPVFPMGRDIGFLPGTKEEKLDPWMQPIYDNIELLLSITDDEGKKKRGHQELIELGLLEIEALTYVRGRSIPKQFMIIDEAQNLSPLEVKTIITRAGMGTKIILTGDPDQIDAPFLDKTNNGLTFVVEKFKDHKIAAHVTLEKGERSELATLAAELL